MSEQPICVYCNKGPFADLQEWAIHACHSKWDMAGTIEKLRTEIKAAQDKIAEIKARSCENCQHKVYCASSVDWEDNPTSEWLTKRRLTYCSAHKPKEK